MRSKVIEPGATLGVFGGGQLGRMFAQAAQRMGYRVIVFTDETDAPASQVTFQTIHGDYRDRATWSSCTFRRTASDSRKDNASERRFSGNPISRVAVVSKRSIHRRGIGFPIGLQDDKLGVRRQGAAKSDEPCRGQ